VRISEKMGLVYTALFLTVSVAVITQNSDSLMAFFRGESSVDPVDDIYTVQSGRDQRLFVLQNDENARSITPDRLHLTETPACGKIVQSGSSFVYLNSTSCTGHQAFTYCLDTGRTCKSATVALRLIVARDPIDSILNGPITNVSGFDAQLGMNGQVLEITNVHLGKPASSKPVATPAPVPRLNTVDAETKPKFSRPDRPQSGAVLGTFSMAAMAAGADPAGPQAAQTPQSAASDQPPSDSIVLFPTAPGGSKTAELPALASFDLALHLTHSDRGFRAPSVMAGIDNSPFGTPCTEALTASSARGGLIRLSLKTPCFPNSRVDIYHSKLHVAVKTGHTGTLVLLLPALEKSAAIKVQVGGKVLKTNVSIPELATIDRVVVQWSGRFNVTLGAAEFGAQTDFGENAKHQPGDIAHALRAGTGFTIRLGDATLANPRMATIYSLPRTAGRTSGVVGFSILATASAATCGNGQIIQSLRSRGGFLIAASGLQFKMPDCGKSPRMVLKNVVRDLIIAAK